LIPALAIEPIELFQMIQDLVANLSPSETELWRKIVASELDSALKANPSTVVSDVYSRAWRTFQGNQWILAADNSPLSFEEYQKIAPDYGPDLTAIRRSRFARSLRKSEKSPKVRSGHPNAFVNFQKQQRTLHQAEFEALEPKARTIRISEIWRGMSAEEKAEYKFIEAE
jgi:hypothetical protein